MSNTDDSGNPKSQPDAPKGRRRVMVDGEVEPARDDRPKKLPTRSVAEILGANEPNAAEATTPPPAGDAVGPTYDPERLHAFLNGQITLGDLEGITKFEQYEMAKVGFSYLTSGKFAQAKTVFDGLVALDPYDAYFHTALGSVAQQTNDLPEADKRYTRALEVNPFSPIALANRGEVRLLLGHLAEGAADLVKAIEEDPGAQYPSTMRARATMQVLREQLQAANDPEAAKAAKDAAPAPAAKTVTAPAAKAAPAAAAKTVTAPAAAALPPKPVTATAWPTAKVATASSGPGKLESSKSTAEAKKPAAEAKPAHEPKAKADAKPAHDAKHAKADAKHDAKHAKADKGSDAAPRGTRRGPRAGASGPAKKKK